jgi:hypothetical protein
MTRFAMRLSMVLALVAGTPGVTAALAGEGSAAASGARIRVTAPGISGKRLVGTLARMDATTLTLSQENGKGALEVPRNAITRIELSRHASRKGRGAKIGTLLGFGAAVAIGLASGEDCGSLPEPQPGLLGLEDRLRRSFCIDKVTMAALSSVLTVPGGALLGWAAAPGESWVATTPDRLRLAVAPVAGGGVGASVSIRF